MAKKLKELTAAQAERLVRAELRALDWRPETISTTIMALEDGMDGVFTYGTVRMVKDLAEIFKDLEKKYGEAPDRRW
jgi:hypothetical protein